MREARDGDASRAARSTAASPSPPPAARGERCVPDARGDGARSRAAAQLVRERVPRSARRCRVAEMLHWPGVLADEALSAEALRAARWRVRGGARRARPHRARAKARSWSRCCASASGSMAALGCAGSAAGAGGDQGFPGQARGEARGGAAAAPTTSASHQEIVLYAARIDVDEELARLVAHIAEIERVLDKGGGAAASASTSSARSSTARRTRSARSRWPTRSPRIARRAQGADRADARAGAEHGVKEKAKGEDGRARASRLGQLRRVCEHCGLRYLGR